MANVRHRDLGNAELHEPKGVATAAANQVYRADGSASGNWEAPLKLISTQALTSTASEIEFTGLSQYTCLFLAIENVTYSASSSTNYLKMTVSTASTYRTSGYINQFLNDTLDVTNGITNGFILGYNPAGVDDGWGTVEIANFNSSARPTSIRSGYVATNFPVNSATPASHEATHHMGIYTTAEAHEKIKLESSVAYDFTSGTTVTLYGLT